MDFPGGSAVKNLPAMQEMQVQSLGWEDPLEEGMATHSSILAWRIPWTEEPGGLQSIGSQRVRHNWMPGAGILHIECILQIAYWVQHFPQHHLSGSGIAQLEFYHCWEQELCPWQRSWGRRLGTCKGGIEPQESPWKFSSIYPQTRVCLLSALCFHLHLWLYGGLSPTTSLWKKS